MTNIQGQYLLSTESYSNVRGTEAMRGTSISETTHLSSYVKMDGSGGYPETMIQRATLGRERALYAMDRKTEEGLNKANARLLEGNTKIAKKIKKLQARIAALYRQIPAPLAKIIELQKEIQDMRANIKPAIDFHAMTARVQAILNSPVSDDDKKAAIEGVRKEAGLTTSEMRSLFTGRIADLYQDSIQSLEKFAVAAPTLRPEIERLKHAKSFLGKLYQPHKGGGFFGKFKCAFKKVGNAIGKVVSKAIGGHLQALFSLGRSILKNVSLMRFFLMRFFPGLGQWTRYIPGANVPKQLQK